MERPVKAEKMAKAEAKAKEKAEAKAEEKAMLEEAWRKLEGKEGVVSPDDSSHNDE